MTAATQQDIQNSEKLLDLSNQLNNSITERRKLLKNITAEEQNYFSTVKQQQKLSADIAANAEKYLGYQIKSKDLAKQIKATDDNINKSRLSYSAIELKLEESKRKAILEARKLTDKDKNLTKQRIDLEEHSNELQIAKQQALRVGNIGLAAQIQQEINANNRNANALDKRAQNTKKAIQLQVDIINNAKKITKDAQDAAKAQEEELAFLKRNLEIRKQIEKSTGLLGGMAKAASKIPGIGQYLNADEAIDEMEKLAAQIEESGEKSTSFGNRMKIAGKGLQVLAKGAYENLKSPEAVFTFFLKAALTANDQAVKLGKSLGYAGGRADAFRENLAGIERASNNLNITTKNLVEAFGELATATGFAYEFTADQLETQIKLTKQVGLTADEAAQVQRFAVLNNKTSEETYRSFLKGITAARNQLRVGIDFKATLAEAVKVSGQLAANLGNNPEIIGKAIVTAKAFGMTLEQVAKSGESLLNFESSIENELKAELLTGKELNLERARAAALAGDQITLAEELNKQVGTAAEFTKMNVLQQRALADSVGMTTDELANTLRKREEAIASGKSLAQITEEEAAQALERQSVQDKFNAAVEKLQSLFGNILAGPLGSFLDMLSSALNIVNQLGNALSFLAIPLQVIVGLYATLKGIQLASLAITKSQAVYEGMKRAYVGAQVSMATGYNAALLIRRSLLAGELAKTIAISAAWAVANPITALAGLAVAGTIAAGLYALTADDMVDPGYGKRTLLSPEGSIKLNDNDTVIAGTNLFGDKERKENILPSQKENTSIRGKEDTLISKKENIQIPQIDLTPMISAINEVRAAVDRLYGKDQSISMDGKKVGTTLVQNSYKVA